MKKDHKTIWANCLSLIQKEITAQSYTTWFVPIVPYKYENNTLTVFVPNQFFYEWLEGHYVDLLRKALCQEIGTNGSLVYRIQEQKKNLTPLPKVTNPTSKKSLFLSNPTLNPHFTFDSLVVGDCNQLAQAAAQAVADNPGKISFNPLMIHGGIGLGKTHIVQATAQAVRKRHPNKRIVYTNSAKFTTQFIQKIRENKTQDFTNFYNNIDLLLIDDVQFLGCKEKTQEIFFHIFNHLHQQNKQIIMTSDKPPSELEGFEKRLLSRFKWGLTVDLQKPDLETRIAIIQSKLSQHYFHISEDLIHFIATSITTNIRELEGVLISLIAYADLKKENINRIIIQQVISNVVGNRPIEKHLNIAYLCQLVASYYKISLEKIKSKSRQKEIVVPRQLIMYLARKYTQNSLKAIGYMLGHRDRSTVSHGLKSIKTLIGDSKNFRETVENIQKIISRDAPLST